MRRIIGLSFLGALALSAAAAHAESDGGRHGARLWDRMCSNEAGMRNATGAADMLGRRLSLTDSQKGLLKDLGDARQKARDDAKAALCGQRPDFSNMIVRYDFRTKLLDARVAAMKAVRPKLEAFYNALDDKQKTSFDDAVRQMWRARAERRWGGDRDHDDDRDGYRDRDRFGDRSFPRYDRRRGDDDDFDNRRDREGRYGYRERDEDDGRYGRDWDRQYRDRDDRGRDRDWQGRSQDRDDDWD